MLRDTLPWCRSGTRKRLASVDVAIATRVAGKDTPRALEKEERYVDCGVMCAIASTVCDCASFALACGVLGASLLVLRCSCSGFAVKRSEKAPRGQSQDP